jgi:hypothetical protein
MLGESASVEIQASEIIRRMKAKEGPDTSVAGRIEQKYESLGLQDAPLSFNLLKALLFEGAVDAGAIRAELDASHYYSDPASEPAWLTAWRGWEVNDDRFEAAVNAVESQFSGRVFRNSEEMLHIFGLRIFFADIRVIQFGKDQVVTQCLDCLDELAEQDKIEEFDISQIERAGGIYCLGHGITQAETLEFQKIFQAFEKKVTETKAAHLPGHGRELLSQLKKDPVGYARKIMPNNVAPCEYYNVPVLATIEPAEFVETVLSLDSTAQSTAFSAFKGRYELGLLTKELAPEKSWIKSVRAELTARISGLRPMSRFRIMNLAGHNIDPFLQDAKTVGEMDNRDKAMNGS